MSTKTEPKRLLPGDLTHPYKIICPKFDMIPMRFNDRNKAESFFDTMKAQGVKSIFTFTNITTFQTKILGYYSPDKRKE